MQKLGQHFLKNTATLQTIADTLEVGENDTLIEVGPGHGELTAFLIATAATSNGAVISIEKDHSLIGELSALAKKEKPGLLTIIEGDVLKTLPDAVTGLRGYKIAGNIPYYITGKLLRVISELEEKPERTVLLIQKEVAERICAASPHMNRLAASVQFWAKPDIVALVPRKDFSPPPDVDSAIVVLATLQTARDPIDQALYYRDVRGIFGQPRKTLLNNLTEASSEPSKREDIVRHLQKIGIDPGVRPQDLSIENIITIAILPIWG